MAIKVELRKRLEGFDLQIEFATSSKRIGILGASGSGKSMTLKMLAGIEEPDAGRMELDGRVLYDKHQKINQKPQQRNIGYLFQNYALFPTMTVEENLRVGVEGWAKKHGKASKAEREVRVQTMISRFQLDGLAKKFPAELSGGQQQRVALARIFAYEPEVILLDEPFSAMDSFLKNRLQQELQEMLKNFSGTIIWVSHDRDEIYQFSEELLILKDGRKIQYGKTRDIFKQPGNLEAAKLTGCKNYSRARKVSEYEIELLDWETTVKVTKPVDDGVQYVGYRAHDFVPVWKNPGENVIKVEKKSVVELPFETQYYLSVAGAKEPVCWYVQTKEQREIEENGFPEYLQLEEEKMLIFRGDR